MKRFTPAWRTLVVVLAAFMLMTCHAAFAQEPYGTPSPSTSPSASPNASPSPSPSSSPASQSPFGPVKPGLYLGGTFGGAFGGGLNDQAFTVKNGGVTATVRQGFGLGTGPSIGAQVGYDWGGPRVEGEFLYQDFGRNGTTVGITGKGLKPSVASAAGSNLDTYSLFVNGYYDFNAAGRMNPYVGIGIGGTSLNASTSSASSVIAQAPGLNQSVFGYQFKVGLGYKLCSSSTLFLQYRLTGTAPFNYGGATVSIGGKSIGVGTTSSSLNNSAVELGIRVKI